MILDLTLKVVGDHLFKPLEGFTFEIQNHAKSMSNLTLYMAYDFIFLSHLS